MKVIEHLAKAKGPLISFEIIPPLRGGDLKDLLALADDLVKYNPPFIDITSHAAEVFYEETDGGIRRRVKRKRPGTLGMCALLQNKYHVDAVPHVLCVGFTREETEDFLIELRYLGIDNVLAVRGDENGYQKPVRDGRSVNHHAVDLVKQIGRMNSGKYLEDDLLDASPTDFCVGIAGYPEKHFAAPNPNSDLRHTKAKIEAGADYIVTQMFFDNRSYFDYVEKCRNEGIQAPIIPGLKILTSKRHLESIPPTFHVDIPRELSDEIEAAKPEHVPQIGIAWAARQAEELLNRNVPAVHFYVMHSARATTQVLKKLGL